MMLGARTGALSPSGAPLPYDAEVEWLRGDGMSYIDTGYIADENTGYAVDLSCDGIDFSYENCIIGVIIPSHCITMRYSKSRADFYFRGHHFIYDVAISEFDSYKRNNISLNILGDGKALINGVLVNSFSLDKRMSNSKSVFLFAGNYSSPYGITMSKIYSAKIYENGEIALDLVPVRVGSVGFMYDRVSGQLFGNSNTGAFIIGPDKTT